MSAPISLLRQLRRISWLIRRDDLAAVMIHLNDLYLIEDRPGQIPGLARVAALVKCIRGFVADRLGEDRTLVVHSGDFLSPSFMSNTLEFKGQQMIELLNLCQVNYATLGNHEFDFGLDVLAQRVRESDFSIVMTNLLPPRTGFPACEKMALWPKADPFLAILGLSGEVTELEAHKAGFKPLDLEATVADRIKEIKEDGRLGAIVALTHMDRGEDRKIQRVFAQHWRKWGAAYLLAGHDHDIDWAEPFRSTVMSKNPSNGKSIAVLVLSKSAVASPPSTSLPVSHPRSWEESDLEEGEMPQENLLPTFDEALASAIAAWRKIVPTGFRPNFAGAFERHIRDTAIHSYGERRFREDTYWGMGERYIIESAARDAHAEASKKDLIRLDGKASWASQLKPDPDAAEAVEKWLRKRDLAMGSDGTQIIRDFSNSAGGVGMDATEASLRRRSTNFGNFVADAIMAATGAELALINAGSFRIDDFVPSRITERDLWETFLFDRPAAVSVVKLTADEVMSIYRHASTKGGSGGFLQVTESMDCASRRRGEFDVAIVTYLLNHPGDGYQKLLAAHRGCPESELVQRIPNVGQDTETLIELVKKGAHQVDYSEEIRLAESKPAADAEGSRESVAAEFIQRIDKFLEACVRNGISKADSRFLVMGTSQNLTPLPQPPDEVASSLREIHEYVRDLILRYGVQPTPLEGKETRHVDRIMKGMDWIEKDLNSVLLESRELHQRRVDYHLYLSSAVEFVLRHGMLKRGKTKKAGTNEERGEKRSKR